MQRFPMTPQGKQRLREELDFLRTVERPAISAAIEEARAHGDLKENAEYHAAKDNQGLIEARIRELETKLSAADVIDPTTLEGPVIRFSATVKVLDIDKDEELEFSIVGEDEADFKRGLLNFRSPIAKALMLKEEGDDVDVQTASGVRSFEILNVEYREIEIPKKELKSNH